MTGAVWLTISVAGSALLLMISNGEIKEQLIAGLGWSATLIAMMLYFGIQS